MTRRVWLMVAGMALCAACNAASPEVLDGGRPADAAASDDGGPPVDVDGGPPVDVDGGPPVDVDGGPLTLPPACSFNRHRDPLEAVGDWGGVCTAVDGSVDECCPNAAGVAECLAFGALMLPRCVGPCVVDADCFDGFECFPAGAASPVAYCGWAP